MFSIVFLVSCGLPQAPNAPITEVEQIVIPIDTGDIETIDWSAQTSSSDTIFIVITESSIDVTSNNYTATKNIEVSNVTVKLDEAELCFLKVNNTVLHSAPDDVVSHRYIYTSTNVLQIQAGNTLGEIAEDHGTTVKRLLELNPGIKNNVLKLHQSLKID